MPSQPAIPPLLSTHLQSVPPPGSVTLVTSVLGASANWIILRQIYAALKVQSPQSGENQDNVVILVSWLRGVEFWKDGARKLVG